MSSLKNIYVPHYTYEDYKQWEGRWELIYGIPHAMSPLPSIRHQQINGNILAQARQNLSGCADCQALMPVDWKIADDIIVQPDISVICHPAKGNFLQEAPVLIFEILSPSTKEKDRSVKYELYENAGVKYYVLVDLDIDKVSVFQLRGEKYHRVADEFDGKFTFELKSCPLVIDFTTIWQ